MSRTGTTVDILEWTGKGLQSLNSPQRTMNNYEILKAEESLSQGICRLLNKNPQALLWDD